MKKIISLFSNIGIAETLLEEIGFKVMLANEVAQNRLNAYNKFYPDTIALDGDFSSELFLKKLVKYSLDINPDVVMATPPCQGMSTAGANNGEDPRNNLSLNLIKYLKAVKPKYVFFENVPQFLSVIIKGPNFEEKLSKLFFTNLEKDYHIVHKVIDMSEYSIPQKRKRVIILMTRKDVKKQWNFPKSSEKTIVLKDVIGDLPSLDPRVKDISEDDQLKLFPKFYTKLELGLKISKYHHPPTHLHRQVIAMRHTPSGCSAFDNIRFKPVNAENRPIKGFKNTYKRLSWDKPAATITMDNVKISSQQNVHPGRFIECNNSGDPIYSDPRSLTLYEIMLLTSLPKNWSIPDGLSEAFIRRHIGEGIPPKFVKDVFLKI